MSLEFLLFTSSFTSAHSFCDCVHLLIQELIDLWFVMNKEAYIVVFLFTFFINNYATTQILSCTSLILNRHISLKNTQSFELLDLFKYVCEHEFLVDQQCTCIDLNYAIIL